eukprot:5831024-Prymnesium_polylepis.1
MVGVSEPNSPDEPDCISIIAHPEVRQARPAVNGAFAKLTAHAVVEKPMAKPPVSVQEQALLKACERGDFRRVGTYLDANVSPNTTDPKTSDSVLNLAIEAHSR